MKKLFSVFLIILPLILFLSLINAYSDSVVNSPHNFSWDYGISSYQFETSKVCVFCHTPHHANSGSPVLWNRTIKSSASFTLYSSSTLQAVQDLDSSKYSLLCLSCHDGSTAINTLVNYWGETFTPQQAAVRIADVTGIGANIGGLDASGNPVGPFNVSLTNDHPVGFIYDATLVNADRTAGGYLTAQLATPDNIGGFVIDTKVRLFGAGKDRMECGSCHDPHDNQHDNFLVKSNVGSALCITCHLK